MSPLRNFSRRASIRSFSAGISACDNSHALPRPTIPVTLRVPLRMPRSCPPPSIIGTSITRGLDPQRVMDLGIWIIVSALAGAKLLLLVTDFHQYTQSPRAFLDLIRSAGVFYGGLVAA